MKVQGAVANAAVKRLKSRDESRSLYRVSWVLGMKAFIVICLYLLGSVASADISGTALIVDGDTIAINGMKVRLNGIDTPELRGSSDDEKTLALEAKEYLSDVTLGEVVTIINPGKEKYGRVLCDLSTDELPSVSYYMLQNPRICKPYDGGTKAQWI